MLDTIGALHLKILQYLMAPHMASNIIANIQYAIEEEEEEYEKYIHSYLNYTNGIIRCSGEEWSTIERLKSIWEAYLVLEKMRAGNRFDFEINIEDIVRVGFLPSLTVVTFLRSFIKSTLYKSSSEIRLLMDVKIEDTNSAVVKIECSIKDSEINHSDLQAGDDSLCLEWVYQKINIIQNRKYTKPDKMPIISETNHGLIVLNSIKIPIK